MHKIELGTQISIYPMPVTLLGTMVEGRANFMALGWVSRVNTEPPMLAASVYGKHHTYAGILETGTFSINVPSADMIEATDYCGMFSGKDVDKSEVFDVFYGTLKTAPMISQCPLCLECRLIHTVSLPMNEVFIGQIMASYTEDRYLTEGTLDIKKMNPILLTMPDNTYWLVGDSAGKAWSIGQRFSKV